MASRLISVCVFNDHSNLSAYHVYNKSLWHVLDFWSMHSSKALIPEISVSLQMNKQIIKLHHYWQIIVTIILPLFPPTPNRNREIGIKWNKKKNPFSKPLRVFWKISFSAIHNGCSKKGWERLIVEQACQSQASGVHLVQRIYNQALNMTSLFKMLNLSGYWWFDASCDSCVAQPAQM